jgi:NOL1/NOP2/sun family putative RNA methylase
MNRKTVDKTVLKRAAWIDRSSQVLGMPHEQTIAILSLPREQSLRINPLRGTPEKTLAQLKTLGWHGHLYSWASDCYNAEAGLEAVRDSELVASGAVYIQNAASWLPVLALDPQPGQSILDVCAAPGGKASHIAALTNNQAELTVNDNSRARLAKMRANLERLGVEADYTLFDATRLARKLEGAKFDAILLDAPCSGEGLMNYTIDKDFATWSVAKIQRLHSLQKQLIMQAWQLLKPGGALVYSTCTMAPEENEAVIDYLLRKRVDAQIQPFTFDLPNRVPPLAEWNGRAFQPEVANCLRLAPSRRLEAFFVCKLHKLAETNDMLYSNGQ